MNIICIYTNHQPIFQGRLNPQHKLKNNINTCYNNKCRPKQCRLRYSLDLNQILEHTTPKGIMPRSSATHYNHHECCITWRTQPDEENKNNEHNNQCKPSTRIENDLETSTSNVNHHINNHSITTY